MTKILVALSTFNRKRITEFCLNNMKEIIDNEVRLVIYDDASQTYDKNFLLQYSKDVLQFRVSGGIERSRARAFRDFEYIYKDFELLYITDNDTIHDPDFFNVLRNLNTVSSVSYEERMPMGFYNSIFHAQAKNIIKEDDTVSIRKTCPGISQCYSRSMVSKIVDFLNKNPVYETAYGFDYFWPAQLGVPFIQTKTSYLEHFARDKNEKGIHSSKNITNPREDFDRDRAINPTSYLIEIREKIIDFILR
jgi:hypothetical protein